MVLDRLRLLITLFNQGSYFSTGLLSPWSWQRWSSARSPIVFSLSCASAFSRTLFFALCCIVSMPTAGFMSFIAGRGVLGSFRSHLVEIQADGGCCPGQRCVRWVSTLRFLPGVPLVPLSLILPSSLQASSRCLPCLRGLLTWCSHLTE